MVEMTRELTRRRGRAGGGELEGEGWREGLHR
jgi:hypothetical protein